MANVRITNSLKQAVLVSVKQPGGYPTQSRLLRVGDSIPNVEFPDVIPEDNLSPYTRELARKGYIEVTGVQAATVEFVESASVGIRDQPAYDIGVKLLTSDGLPLDVAASVEVNDAGTGSGTADTDYEFDPNPKTINFPVGTETGEVKVVSITALAPPPFLIDFSGVPNGAYTMDALLRKDLEDASLFGASGAIYVGGTDYEMSYSVPIAQKDLNGEAQVFVASLLRGTGVYHALMLESGIDPGGWGQFFGREIVNGYQFNLIGTNLYINRVVSDVPTNLSIKAIGTLSGDDDVRVVATVGGSDTTLEVFINDVSKGSYADTAGSHFTNFRVGGFSVNSGSGNGYGVINFRVGPGSGA